VFNQDVTGPMFEKEYNTIFTLGKKTHPNIVRMELAILANFMNRPSWMIVMNNIEGMDGMELMKSMYDSKKKLIFEEWKILGRKLFSALSFLHENDIVHRNIKPQNIMFRKNVKTDPVLIGFNISCISSLCTADSPGTYGYLGPEIAELRLFRGDALDMFPLLKASDVWAMSITLVEMFTFFRPSWSLEDSKEGNSTNTVALEKFRPPYTEVKSDWMLKFSEREKILADAFFMNGLNLVWKRRASAITMEQWFSN
jgi:serine/threonine protein kinase